MKNNTLKESLDEIIADPHNVIINEGNISGNSIEIEYRNTKSTDSFLYYDNVTNRNHDLKILIDTLNQ